ncbi:MAG: hypothetical protein ACO225_05760 [Ilumatobacteraceae bacterium]
MTAIAERRRRATFVGLFAAVLAVVATSALGVAGSSILADSTAGRLASDEQQPLVTRRLPFTATALVGVVDEDGRLASLVIGALEPDGTGGSIVQVPVAADPSSGLDERLTPLDAVFAVGGSIDFLRGVDQLTGLSFDVIEIADERRFAELVDPLGELVVELPGEVRDASSGESWTPGERRLAGADAGRVLTAVDPAAPSWAHESVRAAVWSAVADRVGAGIGSAEPVAADTMLATPSSLDEFVDRLFAGPVGFRALGFRPVAADDAAVRLEPVLREAFGAESLPGSVIVDRADRLLVLGSVAPTRLGAPLDGPTVRIVNGWTDAGAEDVDGVEFMRWIVDVLTVDGMNVVSVAGASYAGEFSTPEVTRVEFHDADIANRFAGPTTELFGGIEGVVVDSPIDGVDLEVFVGRSLLASWSTAMSRGAATVDPMTSDDE